MDSRDGSLDLDDIARRLAVPMRRRRALKLAGVAFAGVAVSPLRPRFAFAQGVRRREQVCFAETADCRQITCPPGTICCLGPDDPGTVTPCPTNPHCCNPCNPNTATCDGGTGYCLPGPIASYCGCEDEAFRQCGDQCCPDVALNCCDRTFTSKSAYCCSDEEWDKENCKDGKYGSAVAMVALGVAAATNPPFALALGLYAGVVGLGNIGFDICADDPPDPDYQALFTPTLPRVHVRSGKDLTRSAARALNRMIANSTRAGAYTIAWVRSLEKAQGAAQAGDDEWVTRHRAAAADYARTAAAALERDLPRRKAARQALAHAGFDHFKITAGQVRRWQRQVRQGGLPTEMTRVLRQAKVDDQAIKILGRELTAVDPVAVAKVGIFGEVSDRRFKQANAKMVATLKRSAGSSSIAV